VREFWRIGDAATRAFARVARWTFEDEDEDDLRALP